ncbi:MAG: fumarylacetoacetate hydrolase family protein [Victivallaceae bacterium]|nr:fumarylacetoacetate hydrolase family protein [Victivallaceae bacterium]MDD4180379.1 fumarylacetoacetate hydrolase family protein [Victivallaceae bacterium]
MIFKVNNTEYRSERIFCVGRNYHAHIQELSNDAPEFPVIFCKPPSALLSPETPTIPFPRCGGNPHFEAELVVLIGKSGVPENTIAAREFIAGLGIGLDLTLRELQQNLIAKSLPWEKSKGFDFSAPIGEMFPLTAAHNLDNLTFSCEVNGVMRQQGHTAKMIFKIPEIILEISRYWSLLPGDLIYTGTPEGVGMLKRGELIKISSPEFGSYTWLLA